MASGMMLMLKQLGLDPEEITKTITGLSQIVLDMKQQMERIENMLKEIHGNQAANKETKNDPEKI